LWVGNEPRDTLYVLRELSRNEQAFEKSLTMDPTKAKAPEAKP
jgi:hypothetical protein